MMDYIVKFTAGPAMNKKKLKKLAKRVLKIAKKHDVKVVVFKTRFIRPCTEGRHKNKHVCDCGQSLDEET